MIIITLYQHFTEHLDMTLRNTNNDSDIHKPSTLRKVVAAHKRGNEFLNALKLDDVYRVPISPELEYVTPHTASTQPYRAFWQILR